MKHINCFHLGISLVLFVAAVWESPGLLLKNKVRLTRRACRNQDSHQFRIHHERHPRQQSPNHKQSSSSSNVLLIAAMTPSDMDTKSIRQTNNKSDINDWIMTGMSAIFLAQFASLYVQLPGLFGPKGLLPIDDRIDFLADRLWVLSTFSSSPNLGMEVLCTVGLLTAAAQIMGGHRLRSGWPGLLTFVIQWVCWHDLVLGGGRFLQYQMDTILLDLAPIVLLGCFAGSVSIIRSATMFGYRWFLARLYLGAGSVKLLSCDQSWRDLSAVHWHFQSQPLPNVLGVWAYEHDVGVVSQALTWLVLVGEMAAPFLFLAPSLRIRQFAFCWNVLLMVGIASFGNFGTLQAVLIVVGFALLDEDESFKHQEDTILSVRDAVNILSFGLAAAAAVWAVQNISAQCMDTLAIEPLAYDMIALGMIVALLPLATRREEENGESGKLLCSLLSLFLVASSVTTLGVYIPLEAFWDQLNIGAQRYGLFATMTGVGGRPVAVVEGATTAAMSDGEPLNWQPIPLLYQINDPAGPLPMCFPHFPRLDWTLWFVPLGERGLWIARLFQGITEGDPAILGLLDKDAFAHAFPTEPPAIIRVVPRV